MWSKNEMPLIYVKGVNFKSDMLHNSSLQGCESFLTRFMLRTSPSPFSVSSYLHHGGDKISCDSRWDKTTNINKQVKTCHRCIITFLLYILH